MKIDEKQYSKVYAVEEPVGLDKLMNKSHVGLDMPCGGNHQCGKCKVKVVGDLSVMDSIERNFLTQAEIEAYIRLACFVEVLGKAFVYSKREDDQILSKTTLANCTFTRNGFGLAIDIGTTTIAMQLYDLSTGMVLSECLQTNAQKMYGSDVISRIQYAGDHDNGAMQSVIHKQLRGMMAECMGQSNVAEIDYAVITGNTVMLHFYEGLETKNIGVAPYTPTSLFGEESKYAIGQKSTYLPSCIGSYVGADVMCAMLSAGISDHKDQIELLVDLGTNGEMALSYKGVHYCASTAAGPAFEGANITFGMRGGKGAIFKIDRVGNSIKVGIYGDGTAEGICGSGVLDAVSVMLELEVIDETGRIDKTYNGPGEIVNYEGELAWAIPNTQILITQKDIRQVQMAKSAIYAGVKTLMDEVRITASDISTVYIAGGFGNYMNPDSAMAIGLFPWAFKNRFKLLGNGALSGAIMLMLDENQSIKENEIISKSKEVVFSGNKIFSNHFIEGMILGQDV